MRKICRVLIVILVTAFLTGCSGEKDSVELLTKNCETEELTGKSVDEIYVYISGEVESEGVYCVENNARLYQVIDKAGGFTKRAQKDTLNLAETVCDGQKIQVLSKKQYKEQESISRERAELPDSERDLLNINTATAEQLTSLPGIGNTKATAIVTHREKNGNFSSIEELKKVSGIGDATYDNIKAMITVN